MGPAAFLCRICARSAARPRTTTTTLGANFRSIRSRGYRSSQWRWSEQPKRQRYARVTLFAAGNSAVLGTLAFVDLPTSDATAGDATWESRLLEASRNELKAAKNERARNEPNKLMKLVYGAITFLDTYLWEPICTTTRFLHLVVIFVPVILGVPAIWFGRRQPDHDNERTGTLWWYGFLVQSMEWAGPAFIKLGQWAASRTDIFPTQMCDVMSKLHSNAPAHSMDDTRRIIEAAFGGLKFDDIFSEFDEKPLGVGAIAQVYKGKLRPDLRLPSDTDIEAEEPPNLRQNVAQKVQSALKSAPQRVPSQSVAVKVLHPGVERTVRRDLRIMGFFAEMLNVIPSMEWLSLPDEVAQFGDMMKLQLDLRIEAANLARFRKNFKDRTTAWFPYPYPELTTRSVLVEEFANGMPLSAFLEFGGGVFQTSIADEGLDAFLRMVLLDNFIHADLHPGNIMVRFYQRSHPEMPRLLKPTDELRSRDDVTDMVISRLKPHLKSGDTEGWVDELEKIEEEGYRPQLIFIDTGLVTELNATNRQNFLDLFRAVAEFDGYKAGHLMCERCRQPEAVIDKEVFALKMQHLVLAVKGRTLALGNIKLGDILQRVLAMVRNHHVRLEGDFVNVVISILLLEGIGRNLNPDADLLRSSLPILRQLSAKGGAEMAKSGDFSMILVWMGLETRRFLQASVEDVERLVKYDLLAPNV